MTNPAFTSNSTGAGIEPADILTKLIMEQGELLEKQRTVMIKNLNLENKEHSSVNCPKSNVWRQLVLLVITSLALTFIQALEPARVKASGWRSVQSRTSFNPNCRQCNGIFKINGQDLYLEKIGDQGPFVVFEAGLGNGASAWKSIYKDVSKFAQVVLYDRAGISKSSPRTVNQNSLITANEVATSLNLLLKEANIKPPYILVGHSLGGLYVQMFARKYPNEVAGVILLDSASPNEPEGMFVSQSKLALGSTEYFEEAGTPQSNQQIRNAGPFPNIPLMVMTATNHGLPDQEKDAWWMELQRELAAASPQGKQIIAQGSGHYIQDDRPALVIDAIQAMILKLQSQRE